MSAKEMFEKLGYQIIPEKNKLTYEKIDKNYAYYICFKLNKKTVYKSKPVWFKVVPSSIDIKELQAINKQIEELGWNNED